VDQNQKMAKIKTHWIWQLQKISEKRWEYAYLC